MKIDKKLIKELVDNLKEFSLTELEYQDGPTRIKVSKASKAIEQVKGIEHDGIATGVPHISFSDLIAGVTSGGNQDFDKVVFGVNINLYGVPVLILAVFNWSIEPNVNLPFSCVEKFVIVAPESNITLSKVNLDSS